MQSNQDMKRQTALLQEQVRLARRADRRAGCLMGLLWTLLFGVFYWGWLAIKWATLLAWRSGALAWAVCWGATVTASVWTWRGSVWVTRQAMTWARTVYQRIRPAA